MVVNQSWGETILTVSVLHFELKQNKLKQFFPGLSVKPPGCIALVIVLLSSMFRIPWNPEELLKDILKELWRAPVRSQSHGWPYYFAKWGAASESFWALLKGICQLLAGGGGAWLLFGNSTLDGRSGFSQHCVKRTWTSNATQPKLKTKHHGISRVWSWQAPPHDWRVHLAEPWSHLAVERCDWLRKLLCLPCPVNLPWGFLRGQCDEAGALEIPFSDGCEEGRMMTERTPVLSSLLLCWTLFPLHCFSWER